MPEIDGKPAAGGFKNRRARRRQEALARRERRRRERVGQDDPAKAARPSLVEPLEPRLLLSSDLLPLSDDRADDHVGLLSRFEENRTRVELLERAATSARRAELGRHFVFIDASIEGSGDLTAGLGDDYRVFELDADRDGVEQIADILRGESGVESIHIFSHGAEGSVSLGDAQLDAESVDAYAASLAVWGEALVGDGDLLLYGCDVALGSSGEAFVERLAASTGADVAASSDLTGAASLGGDWDLEVATGVIDAQALEAAGFEGVLVNIAGSGGDDDFILSDISVLSSTATPDFYRYNTDPNDPVNIDAAAGNDNVTIVELPNFNARQQ